MADISRAFSASTLSKLGVYSKIYKLFETSVSEIIELSRSISFVPKSKAREKISKVTLCPLRNLSVPLR